MTKILLVEDDKSLREIYGVRLLAEGYDIVSAGDGEEALAMAIKERPNLILSDVMMPKVSGFDMLDILRSTTETKDIKVIMMTALSSEDQRLRGEKLGADRYLVKSQVGIEDVVRTVHEVMNDLPIMTPVASAPVSQPVQSTMTTSQVVSATPPSVAPAPINPFAQAVTPSPSAPPLQPAMPPLSTAQRPNGLGDRTVQPLPSSSQQADVAAMIENELNSTSTPDIPSLGVPPRPSAQMIQPAPEPTVNRPNVASLSPQPPAPKPVPNAMPHAPIHNPNPLQPTVPPTISQ